MATIRAFRALRPAAAKAEAVSAVPYDVVNTHEARELAAGNPLSFLHVSRPEIDLPDGVDVYSDAVYSKAAENFEKLKAEAPLFIEETPSLYVYRLGMGDHIQTGIAACCSVDEYDADIVRKHERTRKDKEDDRTRHMLALRAQTGPVFLTYRGRDEINDLAIRAQQQKPLYDFAADGVTHIIWRVSPADTDLLIEGFQAVPLVYVADGHHRAASASRAREELRAKNSSDGKEEYNFFLAVLFPADQLQILPYNRAVKDLNGMSASEFLRTLSKSFVIADAPSPSPKEKSQICMYLEGRWYSLTNAPGTTTPIDPISTLDVSVLQEKVLEPLLGIKDVRTDKRIDFVGGLRGTAALERMVNAGHAAVAFSMYPVTVYELMAIADRNDIMPPKSTWFEPKLRDGLLSHLI
ncbi:MAG: DUF1015 domain-containing protein [Acidobacteria bacterium]|nr:MAG: DUF1015 domain-containing protein [Acidobacteriota bacterium]